MRKTASFYFFERAPIIQKGQCEAWREVADLLDLNAQERLRVE